MISLIPEPAALYMHGFAMLLSFYSLLTHPTGQQYDTQQLRSGGRGRGVVVNMVTPVSFKHDVSLKSTIRKPEIPVKCHCQFLHN